MKCSALKGNQRQQGRQGGSALIITATSAELLIVVQESKNCKQAESGPLPGAAQ
jgi:hypothetical protein